MRSFSNLLLALAVGCTAAAFAGGCRFPDPYLDEEDPCSPENIGTVDTRNNVSCDGNVLVTRPGACTGGMLVPTTPPKRQDCSASGLTCLTLDTFKGECLPGCTTDADCAEDEFCAEGRACLPGRHAGDPCVEGFPCAAGLACDVSPSSSYPEAFVCVALPPPDAGNTADAGTDGPTANDAPGSDE